MPFAVDQAFSPKFKILKPIEEPNQLVLKLASWDANAKVTVSNEPGKKFKVGFVQVLFENDMVATYTKHKLKVTCNPLPVLDSSPGMLPWYEDSIGDSPEVVGVANNVSVYAKMDDKPEDPFAWSHGPGSDLEALKYRLKFQTWLCVRDITTPPLAKSFVKVLCQFSYVIEAAFKVDVSQPVGQRCQFTTLRTSDMPANKPEMIEPPRPVHACVWKDVVANDQLSDVWSDFTIVKSVLAPTGPVNTGVSVAQRRALFGS